MGGWTYFVTNKLRGVLYVGVTTDLAALIMQHRAGTGSAFCRRERLNGLVLAERHGGIENAIAREKALKHGSASERLSCGEGEFRVG